MSKYISQYSASDLLEKLSEKGFVEHNNKDITNFIIKQQQDKELPLYLRALVGVGALIVSCCFMGVITYLLTDKWTFIFPGVLFIASAIGLLKLSGDDNTIKNSVLMQSSFAFMATGKLLFTMGMVHSIGSDWGSTIALLIVTAATYHVYCMSIDRFLSTFSVFFSILVNIIWYTDLAGSKELLLNVFMALQVAGAAVLIANVKITRDYIPLMYGLLFSLCASTVLLASYSKLGYWSHEDFINITFINLLFTLGLIAAIIWIAGGKIEKLKSEPFMLALLGTVLLGFISAPGIILSIILMVVGYAKHEKFMVAMGALLVPVFLYFYYYNLDMSLMEKSGILAGSGAVLLVARFYIGFKKWDKEGAL